MGNTITIRTEVADETCVVAVLAGRVDAGSVRILKEVFEEIIGGSIRYVVVDMERVSFIDSAGLAALVSGLKLARRLDGKMVLAAMQPQAQTVFSLTKLDEVLDIYASRQEALKAILQDVSN
jgi:anti-sigma B factor antagonist